MSGDPQQPVPAERLSPYETVWRGIPDTLHPRLRDYCGAILPGHHGYGQGVFERVGTPRRWLWPFLWLFGRPDVVFPGWHQKVPFTVINRPARSPSGAAAVAASRTFHFTSGDRTMVDAITAERRRSASSTTSAPTAACGRRLRRASSTARCTSTRPLSRCESVAAG